MCPGYESPDGKLAKTSHPTGCLFTWRWFPLMGIRALSLLLLLEMDAVEGKACRGWEWAVELGRACARELLLLLSVLLPVKKTAAHAAVFKGLVSSGSL